jgi:hypothetical protein
MNGFHHRAILGINPEHSVASVPVFRKVAPSQVFVPLPRGRRVSCGSFVSGNSVNCFGINGLSDNQQDMGAASIFLTCNLEKRVYNPAASRNGTNLEAFSVYRKWGRQWVTSLVFS